MMEYIYELTKKIREQELKVAELSYQLKKEEAILNDLVRQYEIESADRFKDGFEAGKAMMEIYKEIYKSKQEV